MRFFTRVGPWCEQHAETDQGLRRTMNEDRVATIALGADPEWGYGVVVADGMGGAAGGERASRIAVETIRERFRDWQVDLARLGSRWQGVMEQHIREIVDGIHARLHREADTDPGLEGMGTTIALAMVFGDRYLCVHVGDSRVYLLRREVLTQLTRDHTWSEYQKAAGQGAQGQQDGRLMQVLGGNNPPEPDFLTGELRHNDLLLAASDGLTKHLDGPVLARELGRQVPLDRLSQLLIAEANRRGGKDNIGVGLLRIRRVPGTALPVGAVSDSTLHGTRGVASWPSGKAAAPATRRHGAEASRRRSFHLGRMLLITGLTIGMAGVSMASYLKLRTDRHPQSDVSIPGADSTGVDGSPAREETLKAPLAAPDRTSERSGSISELAVPPRESTPMRRPAEAAETSRTVVSRGSDRVKQRCAELQGQWQKLGGVDRDTVNVAEQRQALRSSADSLSKAGGPCVLRDASFK